MKNKRLTFFTVIIFIPSLIFSQTKLVLDDKTGFVDEITDSLLHLKLKENNIEYVTMIDYRKKCDYTFSELSLRDQKTILSVKDCEDQLLGSKDLGSSFYKVSPNERVILLGYAITDIVENPGEYFTEFPETYKKVVPSEPAIGEDEEEEDTRPPITRNHHASRLFYTPTAFNLEEGELYYNSLYFLIHDAQYGINDHFSLGMGTTVIGFPFYLTPKVTIARGQNATFAIGDLMMVGTWGTSFFGNVLYGVISGGDQFNNVSFGLGHFYLSGDDMPESHKAMLNISFMFRLSDYMYFSTENYFTGFKDQVYHDTYTQRYDPVNDYYWDEWTGSETYNRNNFVIAGITGFRFINKNKDIISYQVGLSYFHVNHGDVPNRFMEEWYDDKLMVAIPVIGFTRKFGLKY